MKYQFKIKSIKTSETGLSVRGKGSNYISFVLVNPKEGVQSIETIKKVPLKKDVNFSFEKLNYSEKNLFKSTIEFESSIIVKLTTIQKEEKVTQLLKKIGTAITGVLAGAITTVNPGVGIAVLSAIGTTTIGSLLEASEEDKVTILAQREWGLNSTNLKEGELPLALSAPKNIKLKETYKEGGKVKERSFTIKKGHSIAQVILEIDKSVIIA